MPQKLFGQMVIATPIATIPLSGNGPFQFDDIQGYFFPWLTNDDESSLYFYPYYGSEGNKGPTFEVFRYEKRTREVKTETITDLRDYRKEKVYGFYRNLETQSDGILRIDVSKNAAFMVRGGKTRGYYIMNPKDLDAGADRVFLSTLQVAESNLPYMRSVRDMELLVYSRSEKSILIDLALPFTGMYLPITAEVKALQSVAEQNLVFLVLYQSMQNDPIVTVPKNPRRWQVLIYDVKEDALYSVWHGMDETDHLPALSFSYYLGQEALYFEVLKQGKLELYLLEINLKKARPLKQYETVDLEWNNKGLKELWKQKIGEAKAKDPSFEEKWN